jgi:hypothetical protein
MGMEPGFRTFASLAPSSVSAFFIATGMTHAPCHNSGAVADAIDTFHIISKAVPVIVPDEF